MVISYLGLGTNLGNDLQHNLCMAIDYLNWNGLVSKVSSFVETEPFGGVEQDNFLNAVVRFEHNMSPFELLEFVKSIESKMGRPKPGQDGYVYWGPRVIDIDILTFDDLHVDCEVLKIPHVGMNERDFVLVPLREILEEDEFVI